MADRLATRSIQHVKNKKLDPAEHILFPGQLCAVALDGEIIHNQHKRIILDHCSKPDLIKYLQTKFDWTIVTIEKMDWEALGSALKKHKQLQKINILKLIYRWQCNNQRKWKI